MADRYVVSKSRMVRIPCNGPLTAQIERCKLEKSIIEAGQRPDVEIEFPKKPLPRVHAQSARKSSTKLRYK
jgi:hypothetical protein